MAFLEPSNPQVGRLFRWDVPLRGVPRRDPLYAIIEDKGYAKMSIESAKAYVERMKTDKEFARSIVEAKDAEKRNQIIKSAGFDFTKEHFDSVVSELSEDEVDTISGGMEGVANATVTLTGNPTEGYQFYVENAD